MNCTLGITPAGHPRIVEDQSGTAEFLTLDREGLENAFRQSSAAGLLLLASREFSSNLPPELVFWRTFARQFFQSIYRLGEEGVEQWRSVAAPPVAARCIGQIKYEVSKLRRTGSRNAAG